MRPAMVALRPSKRRDVMGTSVGTKRSQEKPGEARRSQEKPGEARRSQEKPGNITVRRRQTDCAKAADEIDVGWRWACG